MYLPKFKARPMRAFSFVISHQLKAVTPNLYT